MNLRPVEGIDGSHTDEEIFSILKKYGITGQEVTSVSYTHLDVYKRQRYDSPVCSFRLL